MEICKASIAKSIRSQYSTYITQFEIFCKDNGHLNIFCIPISLGVELLTSLFREGKSYSSINTARSALFRLVRLSSEEVSLDFGKHPLTVQFMKEEYLS